MAQGRSRLVTDIGVREYFLGAIAQALDHQEVAAQDETVVYLSGMLVSFMRAEKLYDQTAEGPVLRPLALLYGDAVAARTEGERHTSLRRLAEVALFISGLFANSLRRSLVDIDYYIAMGGSAYSRLAVSGGAASRRALREVYAELARRFAAFVEVLSEVGDRCHLGNNADVLRLYEIWLCTGSRRAASKLRAFGIDPVACQRRAH